MSNKTISNAENIISESAQKVNKESQKKEKINIISAINNADIQTINTACKIAVQAVTRTLLLQLKNDGSSSSQFTKIYNLYVGCRVATVTDPDVQDLISTAAVAFYDATQDGKDNDSAWRTTYRAIRNDIYHAAHSLPTDDKILLVNQRNSTPILSDAQRQQIADILHNIRKRLNGLTLQVFDLWAQGYNQPQIAAELNKHKSTISRHEKTIKTIANELYTDIIHI